MSVSFDMGHMINFLKHDFPKVDPHYFFSEFYIVYKHMLYIYILYIYTMDIH